MKIFEFEIQEILARAIEIEATNEDEAYLKIKDMYKEEDIILDSSDHIETTINILNDN